MSPRSEHVKRIAFIALLFAAGAGADTATWTAADGLPPIEEVFEQPDGTLVLGGATGLFVFDGKRFTPAGYALAPGDEARGLDVVFVRGSPPWIGTKRGLKRV